MTQIHLSGADASVRTAEVALRQFWRSEFGGDLVANDDQVTEPETRDVVATISMVLSAPGAVIAVMDLAQRVQLVPKFRRLIRLAAAQRDARGVRLLIDVGDGIPRVLDGLTPEQIIDAV